MPLCLYNCKYKIKSWVYPHCGVLQVVLYQALHLELQNIMYEHIVLFVFASQLYSYTSRFLSSYTSRFLSSYTSRFLSSYTSRFLSSYTSRFLSSYTSRFLSSYTSRFLSSYTSRFMHTINWMLVLGLWLFQASMTTKHPLCVTNEISLFLLV